MALLLECCRKIQGGNLEKTDMGLHFAKLDFLLHSIFRLGELAFLGTRSCTADYVAETMT